jgi:hypothetical protein
MATVAAQPGMSPSKTNHDLKSSSVVQLTGVLLDLVALNGGTDEKVTTIPQPSEGRQSKVNGMVNGTNGVGQHLFHGARG